MVRTKSKDLTKDDLSFASTSKSNSPNKDDESQQSVRVGGRMKKAKIVFDPSLNNMPRKRLRKSMEIFKVSSRVSVDSNTTTSGSMGKTKRHSLMNNINSNISNNSNKTIISNNNGRNINDNQQTETRIKKIKLNNDGISDNQIKEIDIKVIKNETNNDYYNALCLVCFKSGIKKNDRMIACKDCNYKAHLACLKITNECINTSVLGNNWQCSHCKTCAVCFETSDAGVLTTCCICNDAYHAVCHTPWINLKQIETSKWKCKNCNIIDDIIKPEMVVGRYTLRRSQQETPSNISLQNDNTPNTSIPINNDFIIAPTIKLEYTEGNHAEEEESQNDKIIRNDNCNEKKTKTNMRKINKKSLKNTNNNHIAETRTTRSTRISLETSPKQQSIIAEINDLNNVCMKSLPDPSNWTYDDVYKYFIKIFPNEAELFKEHEIDGSSLLLMKRSDIISGMKLKLGPAVKIYNHITMLQTQSTDPRLTWM